VLQGIELSIEPKEAWVVLGPNGAGKSTLVRLVMGLVAPSAGEVEVCGHRLPGASARALALEVAWVPQVTMDDSGFTGLELALMGCAPRLGPWGLPSASDVARAREALAEMDASAVSDRPLGELSGGERRRVWLARALVQRPRLLVLDEPTAFLDVRHQVEMLRVVRRRVTDGLGVLAVLHDVNLAAHFATHVVLLKSGRVLASGPTAEVLTAERLSALYDVTMGGPAQGDTLFVPRW
jgi:iron complex transport system ATP-binding protein